ncbi:DUF397 domain-containing protein [Sphaerisporangium sp. NPDC051011]|uniref:DUF397 domain-containing protein n=1 Tax=Sphaerisporangium sp. NPDC051011 TaxID=3155792 RepID=UPI0033D95C51
MRERSDLVVDVTRIEWRKSSRSGDGPNCVEVARVDNGQANLGRSRQARRLVMVRDSKISSSPILAVSPPEWGIFLDGVKRGWFGDQA